jgi:hypothetical protein
LALIAIVLVGLACATLIQSYSWNQTAHYDLIQAFDNDGTNIDAYQSNTGDKVRYHSHFYSARAPGLALFVLPFYDTLNLVDAKGWSEAHVAPPDRPGDEFIYLLGLWGNVLPGLMLLLLVYAVAERFSPGYGAASAIVLGLGTMVLPLSTLMFSHVFTAFLGFAAFWLMIREREGPPSFWLLWLAGLLVGYAIGSEYPLAFVAGVLGLFLLSRRECLNPRGIARRAGAYLLGALIGLVPLALYNHYAFGSWTHLAYADVPRQQSGFFGIGAPSLRVLSTLLFDSRGLLTVSPVLIMAAFGTVLLYRRGRRAEALTIAAVCLCYLGYDSGYYLPFGGSFSGPRFLATMLPFLVCPLGLALRRLPGPTVALAGASIAATTIATITHPLVGYETETVKWARLLLKGLFQPTIASAYGFGRGWGGIWVFLAPASVGLVLAVWATPRLPLDWRGVGAGALCLLAWGLFAALAPTALGIDHAGLLSIFKAGDHTAFEVGAGTSHVLFSTYPLRALAPIAGGFGLLGLFSFRLARACPRGRRDQVPASLTLEQSAA